MSVLKGNMSRREIDAATVGHEQTNYPHIRPKDAATLIILDGEGADAKMLMGRRHMRHKFMPGLFVFPGGRVDASDGSAPSASELDPAIEEQILKNLRSRPTQRRTRALALACLRETYEEAGLLLGEKASDFPENLHPDWQAFAELGVIPTLEPLRLVARAITPPGRPRRFDTWFFATRIAHIAHRLPEGTGPSGELEDLHWLSISETAKLELPTITKTILAELQARLETDPGLEANATIPFYHLKRKTFRRDLI